MPKYYLHQIHFDDVIRDPEGADYASLDAAYEEAIEGARQIMADRVRQGRDPDHSRFEIVDADGTVVRVVPFEAAIDSSDEAASQRATRPGV